MPGVLGWGWDIVNKVWRPLVVDNTGRLETVAAAGTKLIDADGDTSWDVEQAADEDIVRGKVAGVEAYHLSAVGIVTLAKQSRARAYRSANQVIVTGTETKIELDAENYDNQNEFDSTTNYRFTATEAGYYAVTFSVKIESLGDGKEGWVQLKRNGTRIAECLQVSAAVATIIFSGSDICYLAATDYLEITVKHNHGSNLNVSMGSAGGTATFMAVHKLS